MMSIMPWKNRKVPSEKGVSTNDLFSDFGKSLFDLTGLQQSLNQFPSIDIEDGKKEVKVKAEVPGMDEKDLKVDFVNGNLRIEGEKKEENKDKKNKNISECRYGYFSREVYLGDNVDVDKMGAKYKNGVLHITAPKLKETEEKRKEIKVN